MTNSRAADCDDESGRLLPVEEARARILDLGQCVAATERLALADAHGRVLGQALTAPMDVPPAANSAMDGYAVRAADLADQGIASLHLIGESFAGRPFAGTVAAGQCVRIMTGALMPDGANAVIMQEHARRQGDEVGFSTRPGVGENMRLAGEDLRRGEVLLDPGSRLGPAELGMLASVGVAEVPVYRRIRVGYFSTGDELCSAGESLAPGQIYDSNRYILRGLLHSPNVEAMDLGVVRDRPEAVESVLTDAATGCDVILSSGGVSVGEADYVQQTLERLGTLTLWRIAMKPGKPLAVGRIGDALFLGLPGNPVSVMATFMQFVLPLLKRLSGRAQEAPMLVSARCIEDFPKQPGRMEFQRGTLVCDSQGKCEVRNSGAQGSHVLSSMHRANCFVLLDGPSSGAQAGEMVRTQPFASLNDL